MNVSAQPSGMDEPLRTASYLPEKEGRAESGADSSSPYAAPDAAPWTGTSTDAAAIGAAAAIKAAAPDGAAIGAQRIALSKLVVRHKLAERDPLAPEGGREFDAVLDI